MEITIFVVMSAIVGLIIGGIGFLIGGGTGFNYGFWIGFVPTLILFIYVLFFADKESSLSQAEKRIKEEKIKADKENKELYRNIKIDAQINQQTVIESSINKNAVKNANKNLKMATNTKYAHKQNKKQGIVSCPKCGSQTIATTNKKLSATRGVVGGVIGSAVNPVGTAVGVVAGGLSSKKMYNVCQNCGHKWKI